MTSLRRFRTFAGVLAAATLIGACGDDDDSTGPTINKVLDATVILEGGVTCDNGGANKDFTGTAGKTVAITASGSSTMRPAMTLYAPDFETNVGSSTPTSAGKAALNQALTQSGTYHLVICDVNGTAGSVRVVATLQ